jgi:uncharacterized protein HemX
MFQITILLVLLLGAGGFLGWNYIEKVQLENEILVANETLLNDSIEKQRQALEAKQKEAKQIQQANEELRQQTAVLNREKGNLVKKLSRHELDVLAQAKPGLVEKIINNASKNAMRCFEILSGSPRTHKELAARKKSETNRECPEIANPNYKEGQYND